jgi:hypothetical protein
MPVTGVVGKPADGMSLRHSLDIITCRICGIQVLREGTSEWNDVRLKTGICPDCCAELEKMR